MSFTNVSFLPFFNFLSTDFDEGAANGQPRPAIHGTNSRPSRDRGEVGGVSSVEGSVGSERRASAHPH